MNDTANNRSSQKVTRKTVFAVVLFFLAPAVAAVFAYVEGLIPSPFNSPPVIKRIELTQSNGTVPFPVTATAQVTDKNDDPIEYQWSLNGEPIEEATNESHTFKVKHPGDWKIGVEVSDGKVDKPVKMVRSVMGKEEKNSLPEVELKLSKKEDHFPFEVEATAQATDENNDPLTYKWYLDGQPDEKASGNVHKFKFEEPGRFKIRVEVSDRRIDKPIARDAVVISRRDVFQVKQKSLTGNLEIDAPTKTVVLPEILYTNGFSIDITAAELSGSKCVIRAFQKKAANGVGGAAGNPGSPGKGRTGAPGQAGVSGKSGMIGTNGKSSGSISLNVNSIQVQLSIDNNGQQGGDGGNGGAGGGGGKGGQGRPSRTAYVGALGKKAAIGCKAGPGWGGTGGNGGAGGAAGSAGKGGDAGAIRIFAQSIMKTLNIEAAGGHPGKPGKVGKGGAPGGGGAEGPLTARCDTANRTGAPGKSGADGKRGKTTSGGNDGQIIVEIGGEKISTSKVFKR